MKLRQQGSDDRGVRTAEVCSEVEDALDALLVLPSVAALQVVTCCQSVQGGCGLGSQLSLPYGFSITGRCHSRSVIDDVERDVCSRNTQ